MASTADHLQISRMSTHLVTQIDIEADDMMLFDIFTLVTYHSITSSYKFSVLYKEKNGVSRLSLAA